MRSSCSPTRSVSFASCRTISWPVFAQPSSGAFLQLNAGLLVGAFGIAIEERGWQVVERGLAD
ncbi:MAG: hypothetical protein M3Z54_14375 [Gemmatimonadota bacterium]|nr:hypothetical protein [Gemmatimonadota bacterium]